MPFSLPNLSFSKKPKQNKINNLVKKSSIKRTQKPKIRRESNNNSLGIINIFVKIISFILAIFIVPLKFIFGGLIKILTNNNLINFDKMLAFKAVFAVFFLVIVFRFADLQVIGNSNFLRREVDSSNTFVEIIPAKRGQIFVRDYSKSSLVPVTNTQALSNIYIDPSSLKNFIRNNNLTNESVAQQLSGSLNLSYENTLNTIIEQTSVESPKDYYVLEKYVNTNQIEAVDFLKYPSLFITNEDGENLSFRSWLGYENIEIRSYPERQLLSNTLGFVPRHKETKDALINTGCGDLVSQNERRGTVDTFIPGDYSKGQYTVGYYGLEQKYCQVLSGLNGKKVLNQELENSDLSESEVQNGNSLELTIDVNLQRKAEEILQEAFKKNTNKVGAPTNGTALVMEVKTGKILAMANYPEFDPNEYNSVKDAEAFRNTATNIDYEIGSVMKPLTVAAAVNEWQKGVVDGDGNRTGVSPDWTFEDWDEKGKPYEESNGNILYIGNAEGKSYKNDGPQNLSNILRDSINTGIATIIPTIGNEKLKEYFIDGFDIDKPTVVDLPGDVHGDSRPLVNESNLKSGFIYATFGFGQGYTMSAVQLARAYTALANNGTQVEPYLVENILNEFGEVVDNGTDPASPIYKGESKKVLEPTTARLVTGYLANTIDQGYLGASPSKGQVTNYVVSGKTGTAQVGRATEKCQGGNRYECNTNNGIYDHTFIGYGPEKNPEYLVLMKLAEPNPGVIKNFAENSLGPSWSQLMEYTLDYNGVPTDR